MTTAPLNYYRTLPTFFIAILFSAASLFSYEAIKKHELTVKGEAEYAQGNYNDAIELFEAAMEAGEIRGEPYFYIGSIWELRRDYDKALGFFEMAIELELQEEFLEAALWKLVVLQRNKREYGAVLEHLDALEELGIKHPNLDKFREEAMLKMDPDKTRARELLAEAKRLKSSWEEERPHHDFWDYRRNGEVLDEYFLLHKKAIYLDEELFTLNWTLAAYYEKAGQWGKASLIYRKIENKINQTTPVDKDNLSLVYYKIGVTEKKEGHFSASTFYLKKSRKLILENPETTPNGEISENRKKILFAIDVNLSQSYLALYDYPNSLNHALEAASAESSEAIKIGSIVACLVFKLAPHGELQDEREKVDCEKLAEGLKAQSGAAEVNPGALMVIHFFLATHDWQNDWKGPANGESPENGGLEAERREMERLMVEYRKLLFPARYRGAGSGSIRFDQERDICEGRYPPEIFDNWECPPYWLRRAFILPAQFFYETSRSAELFQTLLFYPYSLKNHENYFRYLAWAARMENQSQVALAAYANIKDRTHEEEVWYLLLLAQSGEWHRLDQETFYYIKKNPKMERDVLMMFLSHPQMKGVPLFRLSDRLRSKVNNLKEELEKEAEREEKREEEQEERRKKNGADEVSSGEPPDQESLDLEASDVEASDVEAPGVAAPDMEKGVDETPGSPSSPLPTASPSKEEM